MPTTSASLWRLESFLPPAGSIEKIYGLMLFGAMRSRLPLNVVELGTGQGYSTAWMLLGLEENGHGHLWTCDVLAADSPIWARCEIPTQKLTYFSNDPANSIQNKIPRSIDFLFHDAGPEANVELEWLLPRISLNGSVVIHGPSPALVFDESEWKYEQILEGRGVLIATRVKLPETNKCKDDASGSMTKKATGLLPGKTGKTISRTTRRSSEKGTKRSRKTRPLHSTRAKNPKAREQKELLVRNSDG